MTKKTFAYTRFNWLDILIAKSAVAATLYLNQKVPDEAYKLAGEKSSINKDAFNLANCEAHNDVIANTIEHLSFKGAAPAALRKLLLDLTSRNTYGTFCELSAYAFLLKGNFDFDIQTHMNGAEILNPNGADLDGLIRMPEEIYFDIKAFGFHEHLVTRLTERLSEVLTPNIVVAQDSWDVPIYYLFDLLSSQFKPLLDELKTKRVAHRGAIRFEVKAPSNIQITTREIDPLKLAEENAEYAFSYAKQFVRNKPFFLIFVIHPWVSGSLHQNFSGYVDNFTRAFAQRTFCQFNADNRPVFDLTMAEAARLLSGILFVNAWEGEPPSEQPRYRLFLNPLAKNKPEPASIQALAAPYGDDMAVVDIQCTGSHEK